MSNKIPRTTQIIIATPKNSYLSGGQLVCYKNENTANWRGIGKDGKWYYVFSSILRNSSIYDIECFNSWDEFDVAQKGKS